MSESTRDESAIRKKPSSVARTFMKYTNLWKRKICIKSSFALGKRFVYALSEQ